MMNRNLLTALATLSVLASVAGAARPATAAMAGDPQPGSNPGFDITGHVVWEGRLAQPNTRQEMALTVHLTQLDNVVDPAPEAIYEVISDKYGIFALHATDLPLGKYEWRAKGAHYLSNSGELKIDLSGTAAKVEMGLMRAGDAVSDNVVNARDFSLLTGAFNKSSKDPGFTLDADFTGDGVVNISDYSLLASHFGQRGN
jgi:hypothetical protein